MTKVAALPLCLVSMQLGRCPLRRNGPSQAQISLCLVPGLTVSGLEVNAPHRPPPTLTDFDVATEWLWQNSSVLRRHLTPVKYSRSFWCFLCPCLTSCPPYTYPNCAEALVCLLPTLAILDLLLVVLSLHDHTFFPALSCTIFDPVFQPAYGKQLILP
jgi:hypothetical protein